MRPLNKKKLLHVFMLTLILVFSASRVTLAKEADLKKLDISVKAEYDQEKKVFLQYAGELDSASASSNVIIYTPSTMIQDETFHSCAIDSNGEHQCQAREKSDEGNLSKYNITMPQKNFNMEGYSEGINDKNGKKDYEYTFKAGQDIDELSIHISEPDNAKDFKISPSAAMSKTDEGLNVATYSFNSVKKGTIHTFKVSYTKEGWKVVRTNRSMGSDASATGGSSSGSSANTLGIVGAFIAAFVLAFGAFYFFSKKDTSNSGRPSPVAPKGKSRFCTNCGTRLDKGVKYCPNCGKQPI